MPDDWQPRRRGYNDTRDDYDEEFGRVGPREKVLAPGMALLILGWIGVFFSILVMGGAIVFAFMAPPPDTIIIAIVYFVMGLIMMASSILFVLGGNRMRQCRNWGLAMTASIFAICSITIISVCAVFVMPFGIWALIVLLNADVKREFERVAGNYRRPSSDDWD